LRESATKTYFDEQVTKFGNKQEKGSLARGELPAKVTSLGVALIKNGGRPKQKGNIFSLRSLNALRDQGKVGGRPPSTSPLYADIIMDTIGEGTDVTTGIDGEY